MKIRDVRSKSFPLECGVPQGSVLGPSLFTIYSAYEIGSIVRLHNLDYHMYADDTQLYVSFRPSESTPALQQLESCIEEIELWMTSNRLKLNNDKTEILLISTQAILNKIGPLSIRIGSVEVSPRSCVRNLGALIDSNLTMEQHVSAICKACGLHIHNIGKIVKYLTSSATEKLVHSLISSRLDSNNSLLYGISDTLVHRLQLIQNTAARLVTRTRKHEHVSPVLQSLHWLPVHERIIYKVLLLTFKALHELAPSYLSDLLTVYTPSRALRSQSKNLLSIPQTRLKSFGDRAFCKAAPTLWNSLPLDIRSCKSVATFKSKLKTYLFKKAYY